MAWHPQGVPLRSLRRSLAHASVVAGLAPARFPTTLVAKILRTHNLSQGFLKVVWCRASIAHPAQHTTRDARSLVMTARPGEGVRRGARPLHLVRGERCHACRAYRRVLRHDGDRGRGRARLSTGAGARSFSPGRVDQSPQPIPWARFNQHLTVLNISIKHS